MKLWSHSFNDGQFIPSEYAFGVHDPEQKMRLGPNRNPHLAWDDHPAQTRSLVVICVDPDVPGDLGAVNQPERTIAADAPRVEFFHWVMVNVNADFQEIAAGSCSDEVTAGGKNLPRGPEASLQGLNDYTNLFAADPDMAGNYLGYDGPCPPWNDTIPHRYRFCIYAIDLDQVPVQGEFTGRDVLETISGHILAQAKLTGLYSLNPDAGLA